MKQEIHCITEAFSMQPASFIVGNNVTGGKIAKIVKEQISMHNDWYDYYIGYDEKSKKLFECRRESVNVFYK